MIVPKCVLAMLRIHRLHFFQPQVKAGIFMGCVTLVLLICIDSTSVNAVCELASGVRKRVSILWTASSGPFVRKKKESVDTQANLIDHITQLHTHTQIPACLSQLVLLP